MKLKITFPVGTEQKAVTYDWNDKEDYSDNMRKATIKAMDEGLTLQAMREDRVTMEAIKERDGERCPCCGMLLK